MDNNKYKAILLEYNSGNDSIPMVWIENLGALNSFDYKHRYKELQSSHLNIAFEYLDSSLSYPIYNYPIHAKCKFVDAVIEFNTDSILLSERSDEACDYHQSISLAIKDKDVATLLKIFPNPTSSILTIETELTNAQYQVFDIYGRLVSSGKIDGNQIDVSRLVSGLFLLQVDSGEKLYSARFLKE